MKTPITDRFSLLGLLSVIAAAVIGFLVCRTGQWLGAGNRPSEDVNLRPCPVRLEHIAPDDQWLLDFNVFLYPVYGIRSDSSYVLLVLEPKRENIHPPGGEHEFVLDGFESDCEKPVFIEGDFFKRSSGAPEIIVLDFLTAPKMSENVFDGKTLRLRSADYRQVRQR
jgi:hypothetical protein